MRAGATRLLASLRRGFHAQGGATTVEYGIVVAVLGIVFIVAGQALFGGFGSFRDLILGGFSS
jgi:Flp pilus assembly pilin Flp